MSTPLDSVVSIERCIAYCDPSTVKDAVRKALDELGGLESLLSFGDSVLIKPNLVCAKPYTCGATTNPWVLKALAELSMENGAGKVIIGDGSAVGHDTLEAFRTCGLDNIARELNCTLVDFTKGEFQYVVNPLAKLIKRIRIPRAFIEANVVINVPVMKTHDALGVTLGLKNMKGIIHLSDKKRFHKWGLAQAIVDLAQIAKPQLTVIDGTVGMEGNGPVAGDPVGMGLILASTDTVACDRVAAEIMGFKAEELDYIRLASEAGLGTFELENITIVGESLANSTGRPFKRTTINSETLGNHGIHLLACDACSGCSHAVTNYLLTKELKGTIDELKGYTIVYGQNAYIPVGVEETDVIRFGSCTKRLSGAKSVYVPGCPRHPNHMDEKLKNLRHA